MEAAMLGLMARGTYVVVLATMIVAWVVSFNKLDTQPSQATWHMYS